MAGHDELIAKAAWTVAEKIGVNSPLDEGADEDLRVFIAGTSAEIARSIRCLEAAGGAVVEWRPIAEAVEGDKGLNALVYMAGAAKSGLEPVAVAVLDDGQWWLADGKPDFKPTHFIPLPDLPKVPT